MIMLIFVNLSVLIDVLYVDSVLIPISYRIVCLVIHPFLHEVQRLAAV